MGTCNCIANKKAKNQRIEDIESEISIKKKEKIILFIGERDSGKSLIIDQIIDSIDNKNIKSEFIKSKYNFKSFMMNEYTSPLIKEHCSKSLKHLKFINDNLANIKYSLSHDTAKEILSKKFQSDHHSLDDMYRFTEPPDTILVSRYILNIAPKTPKEIMKLIQNYYDKHIINTCKVIDTYTNCNKLTDNIYDLWEVSIDDFKYLDEIYAYTEIIVFVCDLSVYDECNDEQENKLIHSLNLFGEFIAFMKQKKMSIADDGVQIIVFFNKLDIFIHKICQISITKCPLFENLLTENECKSNQDILVVVEQQIQTIIKSKGEPNRHETIIMYSQQDPNGNRLWLLREIRYQLIVISNRWVKRFNDLQRELRRINALFVA